MRMVRSNRAMGVMRLYFLLIVFVHCDASEPYCRQFEYDEKMLTKMIKTEIALEAMKKELTTLEDKLDRKVELGLEENNKRLDVQSIDGGWGRWSDWSACTTSCGGGIQSRYRSCDDPARYLKGKMCEGPPIEYRSCATEPCQAEGRPSNVPKVGFTVTSPNGVKNGALWFRTTHSNYGGDFNLDSGRFVCEVPGLYLFTATLLGNRRTSSACYCYIYVGSTSYTFAYAHTKYTGNNPSGSASLVFQLQKGDEVYLGGCVQGDKLDGSTHFSGVLIH